MDSLKTGNYLVLTGPPGSGKSSFLSQVGQYIKESGYTIGGYWQPVVMVDGQRTGYDLADLATGQQLALARRSGQQSGFVFDGEVFALASTWLRQALDRAEIIFLDEAGFIEAGGGGHFEDLSQLVKSRRPALVAARQDICPQLLAQLPLAPAAILTLPACRGQVRAAGQLLLSWARRPLGINFLERWPQMVRARSASCHNDFMQQSAQGRDPWIKRASDYGQSHKNNSDGGLLEYLQAQLLPSDIVLDIGAGTGRHSLAMARYCSHVLAMEPSAAMRGQFSIRLAAAGLSNVTVEPRFWPEAAAPDMADIVFSSHVLYGQEDGSAFINAMTRAARRLAILSLAQVPAGNVLDNLRAVLWGTRPEPSPAAEEALLLARQMGLDPQFIPFPGSRRPVLTTLDEDDLQRLAVRLNYDGSLSVLADAVRQVGLLQDSGSYLLGYSGPNCLLVWNGQG